MCGISVDYFNMLRGREGLRRLLGFAACKRSTPFANSGVRGWIIKTVQGQGSLDYKLLLDGKGGLRLRSEYRRKRRDMVYEVVISVSLYISASGHRVPIS